MTCLIIDDEKLARNLVSEYLLPFNDIEVIGEAANGEQAIAMIDELQPDLVFLDVQMPDMNGFQVLQTITHRPAIIFTTAYDQYAIKAFEAHAIDYLLKPLDEERFQDAIAHALSQSGVANDDLAVGELLDSMKQALPATYPSHFIVQKSNKMVNIATQSIMYLEASGDYTIIHCEGDGEFLSSKTLTSLAQMLDPSFFLRIHRSTVINMTYLKEVERPPNRGMQVTMRNNKQFSVSRKYSVNIRDRLL